MGTGQVGRTEGERKERRGYGIGSESMILRLFLDLVYSGATVDWCLLSRDDLWLHKTSQIGNSNMQPTKKDDRALYAPISRTEAIVID